MSARRPGDLRAWLAAVEARGALKHVSGASADFELGRIVEVNNSEAAPHALLFENIPGYGTARLLASAIGAVTTFGTTLGIEAADTPDLQRQLRGGRLGRWFAEARSTPFEWVAEGAVMQNAERGADVDLGKVPAPLWNANDGGRYIGTGGVMITQDPETKAYNSGTYRMMLLDGKRLTQAAAPTAHGTKHIRKYLAQGKPAPVVISLGHDPLCSFLGGLPIPDGTFEFDVASAMLGNRCRMIAGSVTGLPIPADAEIVLEGWVRGEDAEEGPFGEFLGYYSSEARLRPVVNVEAVYYRNDPIVLGMALGKPPNDLSYGLAVQRSARVHDQLEGAGVPGVTAVWADMSGSGTQLITVAIRQQFPGHARQAGTIASQCAAAQYLGRYVIVVDDDIDPTNLREVMWAVSSRSDPAKDIITIEGSLGGILDPLHATYAPGTLTSSRGIIDACRPYHLLKTFPGVAASSREDLNDVRRKWAALWER